MIEYQTLWRINGKAHKDCFVAVTENTATLYRVARNNIFIVAHYLLAQNKFYINCSTGLRYPFLSDRTDTIIFNRFVALYGQTHDGKKLHYEKEQKEENELIEMVGNRI